VTTISQDESLENDECFVMFVMSHGKDNCVFGSDGQAVKISEIMSPFTNANCTFLKNKPKLVFIQACRGGTRCVCILCRWTCVANEAKCLLYICCNKSSVFFC